MKLSLKILGLLFCLSQLSFAGEITFTEISTQAEWDETLNKAKAQGQLVFVDVYATWCGYCKKMDREVYSQDAVGEFYNGNFVNVRLDGEAGIGPEIVQRYEISGFPELLFIDAENHLITKGVGYIEEGEFRKLGSRAIKSWKRLPELQKQLEAGKMVAKEGLELADLLSAQGQENEALAVAVKILGEQATKELMPYHAWILLSKHAHALGNPLLEKVIKHRDEFVYMRGEKEVDDYIQACMSSNLANAVQNQDEALMQRIVKELIPLLNYELSPMDRAQMAGITQTMFYQKTENWAKYSKAVDDYLTANPKDDDFALSQAKEVLQMNLSQLNPDALRWCKLVIDRHPEGKFEAEAFYAITLARTGKKEEAKNMVIEMQERYATDEEKSALSQELMQYIEQQ